MVATRPDMPPPSMPPHLRRDPPAATSAPIEDMAEDLQRFNSVLDYLETHGDGDTFGVVSMMRPFATSLENRLRDLQATID